MAAVGAVAAGVIFRITAGEWIAVVLAIGFVLAMEIVNTAIERLADFVSPGQDERIGAIKDLGAAATLVSAVAAGGIGAIVFLPRIVAAVL